jgi:hypothetical protein
VRQIRGLRPSAPADVLPYVEDGAREKVAKMLCYRRPMR